MDTPLHTQHDHPIAGEGWVEASFRYARDGSARLTRGDSRLEEWYGNLESYPMRVHDIRPQNFTLDRNGVLYRRHQSRVRDWFDMEELKTVYFPEIEALVREETGAAKVIVYSPAMRVSNNDRKTADEGKRGATYLAHNDMTEFMAKWKARWLLTEDEIDFWMKKRFMSINVWRPARGPVQTSPFAVADAATVRPQDFIAADETFPGASSQTFTGIYNPDHRWFYAPKMQTDEILLFKNYDSARDGRARYTLHSAFDDPTAPPDAPPRHSVEVRTMSFFYD